MKAVSFEKEREHLCDDPSINAETPEGSQAVTWLKSRDKKEYPSYSDLITEAVNFFCARRLALENDPYLETRQKEDRFLQQMEERIEQAICTPARRLSRGRSMSSL